MKKYTVREIVAKPSLFDKAPFQITRYGRVIGTFTKEGGVWFDCENCGDPTRDLVKFENEEGEWERLVLCEECKKKLI